MNSLTFVAIHGVTRQNERHRATHIGLSGISFELIAPCGLRFLTDQLRLRGFIEELSVFRCELTARQFVDMKVALLDALNTDEDQILVVDLGAADGRGEAAISSLGRVYRRVKRTANVF